MYLYATRKGDEKKCKIVYEEDEEYLVHPDGKKEPLKVKYVSNGEKKGYFAYFTNDGKRISKNNISNHISSECAYWRKFNALHNWFVNNYDGAGNDDCTPHLVSIDKVRELVAILAKIDDICPVKKFKDETWDTDDKKCKEVAKLNKDVVELLETCDGFFFGSTDYDAYYFFQVRRTLKVLKKLLRDVDAGKVTEITYRASW